MAIDDLFAMTFELGAQGRRITNQLGYRQSAGSDDVNITQILAEAWESAHTTELQNLLSGDTDVHCIYVRKVAPVSAPPWEIAYQNIFGTGNGKGYPNNGTYVLKQKTTSPSSKDNGRIYVTGFGEDETASGLLDSVYVNGPVQTFIDDLLNPLTALPPNDQTFRLVVLDKVLLGVELDPILSNDVAQITTDGVIYQQSRRRTKATDVRPTPV